MEQMPQAYIFRKKSTRQGTLGILAVPEVGFSAYTMELPWYYNINNYSCIPKGDYIVRIRKSPKYGYIFHIKDVKGRRYILIHSGNVAGDTRAGYKTHSQGCILIGKTHGRLWSQTAVYNSRVTLNKFMRTMNNKPFKLKIL